MLLLNPRVGEFKQMIATLEAREAEHRKSGKSSSYLGWMLPGGGDAPSPAAADKEGKRDGDAGAAAGVDPLSTIVSYIAGHSTGVGLR